MIKPTVGRVVIFKTRDNPDDEFAAIVCRVWNDRKVNLAVFDGIGNVISRIAVRLLQDDDHPADGASTLDKYWCQWMPYQKGQAAKTEAAEKSALELGAAARTAGPAALPPSY